MRILYFVTKNSENAKRLTEVLQTSALVKAIPSSQVIDIAKGDPEAIFCWDEEEPFESLRTLIERFSDLHVYIISSFRSGVFLRQATASGAIDVWVWAEVKEKVEAIYGKPLMMEEPAPPPVAPPPIKKEMESPAIFRGFSSFYAVIGGKGGVGNTTTLISLAAAIREETELRTILVDLSETGGVARYFCFDSARYQRDWLTWLDHGQKMTEQQAYSHMYYHPDGDFYVLPLSKEALTGKQIEGILTQVSRFADIVLIDVGRGRDAISIDLLSVAKAILLVTTPTTLEIRSSQDVLTFLRGKEVSLSKIQVVLNQVSKRDKIKGEYVENLLKLPIAISLPETKKMEECILENTILYLSEEDAMYCSALREWVEYHFWYSVSAAEVEEPRFSIPFLKRKE